MRKDVESAIEYLTTTVLMNLKMDEESMRAMADMVDSMLTSKKIFLYGVGRSGLVAKAFAIRLVQLGLNVFFVGESNTPMVEPEDCVILLSNTGQTMSAVQTANITRRIGAKVFAITSNQHSKLASAATRCVVIAKDVAENDEKWRYAPLGTIFEHASGLLLDAIITVLMKRLNESDQSMRKRHAIWV